MCQAHTHTHIHICCIESRDPIQLHQYYHTVTMLITRIYYLVCGVLYMCGWIWFTVSNSIPKIKDTTEPNEKYKNKQQQQQQQLQQQHCRIKQSVIRKARIEVCLYAATSAVSRVYFFPLMLFTFPVCLASFRIPIHIIILISFYMVTG